MQRQAREDLLDQRVGGLATQFGTRRATGAGHGFIGDQTGRLRQRLRQVADMTHAVRPVQRRQRKLAEVDVALGRTHAGNRLEEGRLAHRIRPEHTDQ